MYDVLVSAHVLGYERVREGVERENRNVPVPINDNLAALIQQPLKKWAFAGKDSQHPFIGMRYGVVLCGDKLIDSQQKKEEIMDLLHISAKLKLSGLDVVGGEMENGGMMAATRHHRGMAGLLMKGISDWGADKDVSQGASSADTKATNQRCATYAALHLMVHTLALLKVTQSFDTLSSSRAQPTSPKQLLHGQVEMKRGECAALDEVVDAQLAVDADLQRCEEETVQRSQQYESELAAFQPELQKHIAQARQTLATLESRFIELHPPSSPPPVQADLTLRSVLRTKKDVLQTVWPSKYRKLVIDDWTVEVKEKAEAKWTLAVADAVKNVIDDRALFTKVMAIVKKPIKSIEVQRKPATKEPRKPIKRSASAAPSYPTKRTKVE